MSPPIAILDLYLLSLLDRGLSSFYELQKRGGLSLGASTPSLKRLVKAGLAKKSDRQKTGNRVRYQFLITPAGREAIRTGLRTWISGRAMPGDVDALLRLIDLAVHYDHPLTDIAQLCSHMAHQRRSAMALAHPAATDAAKLSYPVLREAYDKELFSAQARALNLLVRKLGAQAKKRHVEGKLARNSRRGASPKAR